VQILRSLLTELGDVEFARVASPGLVEVLRVVPQLRARFPDVAAASIEDAGARFASYDSIVQLLVDAAALRPMLVVLDDLQWADTPSMLLVQLLAGSLPQSRLTVVGTYRDRELAADHPLRMQLADFIRRGETAQLQLGGLANGDVRLLVRGLTGFQPARDVVERLQAQTGGNPFFLNEVSRVLSAEEEGKDWRGGAVPQGVEAVLRRRLEALSKECRSVLETASVAGHELEIEQLAVETGIPRPQLLDLLDEALETGLLRQRDGGYEFAHGLVRGTVYGGLSTARRAELHGLIGRTLEQRTAGDPDQPFARLAHHFAEAAIVDPEQRARALNYSAAAGKSALSELAYEEAAALFQLALAMVPQGDPAQRAQLLLDLGRARYLAGEIAAAISAAREVGRMADQLDDPELRARAALVVRGVGGPGLSDEVKELCDAALRPPPDNVDLRIQVLSQLTAALMQMGGLENKRGAVEPSREALRLSERTTDTDSRFAALHARQMAAVGPEGVEERLLLADRVFDLARESGRASLAQWGYQWRIDALMQLGRIDDAEFEIARQAQLAERLREPILRWRTLTLQSYLAMVRGRFKEAALLSEQARMLARRGRHVPAEFLFGIQSLMRASFVGGLGQAWEAVRRFHSEHPETPGPIFDAGVAAMLGDLEGARAALRPIASVGLEKAAGPVIALLPALTSFAEAISAVGDAGLAAAAYEALLPHAGYNAVTGSGGGGAMGSVPRYLGMLAATLERWDEAARHFEDAISFERRMGSPPFVARTQVHYAEMLIRRGRDGDLHHARRLVQAALETSRRLGMEPWQQRANVLLGGLDRRGVADHPLSSRELEVAHLVAEGLSNRMIAERLHLSERTAESHVKNICDKLGFNSRSQVAAWVAGRQPEP
jgi:DNA-binding CsgD family transcriptional regulator/tetratricopeptide (TPR) repeat protein